MSAHGRTHAPTVTFDRFEKQLQIANRISRHLAHLAAPCTTRAADHRPGREAPGGDGARGGDRLLRRRLGSAHGLGRAAVQRSAAAALQHARAAAHEDAPGAAQRPLRPSLQRL